MKNNPMVSVIIPVYNNINWLEKALTSVLNQTYKNYEIIVVDDGSSENIRNIDVIKNNPKIKYYKNSNHGVAYSRNYGIKKSNGDYVAFLDSDDFWCEKKLEKQIQYMILNKAYCSQHSYKYYYEGTKEMKKNNTYIYHHNPRKFLFRSFKVQTSTFMIKKDILKDRTIQFDESKIFGEDSVFYIELMKKYKLLCIDEYLGFFRIRGNNSGFDIKKQIFSRINTYNQYKNDVFFIENTSYITKFAYKYLVLLNKIKKLEWSKNNLLLKIIYFIPWLIFKIETSVLIWRGEK